jgi:hypothetical protein
MFNLLVEMGPCRKYFVLEFCRHGLLDTLRHLRRERGDELLPRLPIGYRGPRKLELPLLSLPPNLDRFAAQ